MEAPVTVLSSTEPFFQAASRPAPRPITRKVIAPPTASDAVVGSRSIIVAQTSCLVANE